MKEKNINYLAIISLIGGVLAAGFGLYMLIGGKSDVTLFTEAFGSKSENYLNSIKDFEIPDLNKKVYKLDSTINLGTSDYTSSLPVVGYLNNNNLYYDFALTNGDKGVVYYNDSKLYISVSGVDKVYYMDFDMMNNTSDVLSSFAGASDGINKIIDYIVEEINSYINKDTIKSESVNLSINGKDIKTKELSLSFTLKDIYTLVKKIGDKVTGDKELVELYKSLTKFVEDSSTMLPDSSFEFDEENDNYDDDFIVDDDFELNTQEESFDLVQMYKNIDSLIEKADSTTPVLKIAAYYDGNEVVSRRISASDKGFKFSIILDNYKNDDKKEVSHILLKFDDSEFINGKFTKLDENKVSLDVNIMSMFKVSGEVSNVDNNFVINLKVGMSYGDQSIDVGNINLKLKEIKKNEEYDIDFGLSINMMIDVSLGLKGKMSLVNEMPTLDISNSINIDDITDEDREKISNLFDNMLAFTDEEDA